MCDTTRGKKEHPRFERQKSMIRTPLFLILGPFLQISSFLGFILRDVCERLENLS
jgi:hypothetical protein